MYSYTLIQWLLFFYTYCFLGWVWETTYVSICSRKFSNRGFLTGPFLPIYGSGAIIVLLATIPVKDNLWHVFWFGMIAATLLEYITGALMEKIFKVRYWDYTNEKFNLKGYICLECSIAWGFFSIAMVKLIHKPVEMLYMQIPARIQEVMAIVLCISITIDMAFAIHDALDLREMLMRITENSEEIQKIEKRLEYLLSVLGDEKQAVKGKIGGLISKRDDIEKEIEVIKEKMTMSMAKLDLRKRASERTLRLLKRNPKATSKTFAKALSEIQNLKNNGGSK